MKEPLPIRFCAALYSTAVWPVLAHRRAPLRDGAGVGRGSLRCRHLDRRRAVGGAAVSELATAVLAPAPDPVADGRAARARKGAAWKKRGAGKTHRLRRRPW